jgi:hypothetical protein
MPSTRTFVSLDVKCQRLFGVCHRLVEVVALCVESRQLRGVGMVAATRFGLKNELDLPRKAHVVEVTAVNPSSPG